MRDSGIRGGESFHRWQHRGSPLVAVASNAPIFGSGCTARRHVDLAVFQSVSKRHSTRLANGGVAPADEIWKACLNEFKAIDSATIAKAFVMAYRIAGKVIEHKGGNEFLRTDETHLGCRRDFIDTEFGIQPVVK
jgi:hypothetical protein